MLTKTSALSVAVAIALGFIAFRAFSGGANSTETVPTGDPGDERTAIFAGGCFWCMEAPFEKLPGISAVESGYTGGTKENPTYQEVCSGTTGHLEAVRVTYDASRISYNDLLEVFWRNIDPTDDGGQFVDRGDTYLSAIFVADDAQREFAQGFENATRRNRPVRQTDRNADQGSRNVLPRGRLPPGLLQKESTEVSDVPIRFWTRPVHRQSLGRRASLQTGNC